MLLLKICVWKKLLAGILVREIYTGSLAICLPCVLLFQFQTRINILDHFCWYFFCFIHIPLIESSLRCATLSICSQLYAFFDWSDRSISHIFCSLLFSFLVVYLFTIWSSFPVKCCLEVSNESHNDPYKVESSQCWYQNHEHCRSISLQTNKDWLAYIKKRWKMISVWDMEKETVTKVELAGGIAS